MIAAQLSPPTSSSRPFPISASTQCPTPAPTRSGRLFTPSLEGRAIFDPNRPRPFVFILLPALKLSCLSFSCPRPLFSIVCGLFCEKTGGGIPLPLRGSQAISHGSPSSSCAKAQKAPPVSPFPATLTDSLLRKSFPCRSYANTRGVRPTPRNFFASGLQFSTVDRKLPSALTTFRINTCISVASKQLYLPLVSTLMKKGGEGVSFRVFSSLCSLCLCGKSSFSVPMARRLTPSGRRPPPGRGRSQNPRRLTRERQRRL